MLSFKELLELTSWGVPREISREKERREKYPPMKGSIKNGGHYRGVPGLDIAACLPELSNEEMLLLADELSDQYPKIAPEENIGYAGCIRDIHGEWTKGRVAFTSIEKLKNLNIDFELPGKFIKLLEENFIKKNNNYGLCVLYEVSGHRYGDQVLIFDDETKMKQMWHSYMLSVKHAHKCNSDKHKFTPYYWAAMYFKLFGKKKKALRNFNIFLKILNDSIEDGENYRIHYPDKVIRAFQYISLNIKNWNLFFEEWKQKAKNIAIKTTIEKNKAKRNGYNCPP